MNAGGGFTSNPYSTAVKFDSTPYLQFEQQRQARQAARDEAVKKGIADFGKDINPAGMHQKDVATYTQKKNEFDNYGKANMAKLIAQDPTALQEYARMRNDLIGGIEMSKRDVPSAAKVLDILSQKKGEFSPNDISNYDSDKSEDNNVWSKNYKPIDPSKYLSKPEAKWGLVEQKRATDRFGTILNDEGNFNYGKAKTLQDDGQGNLVVGTPYTIRKEAIPKLLATENEIYNTEEGFRNHVDKQLKVFKKEFADYQQDIDNKVPNPRIPQEFNRYNQLYKKVVGHDIDMTHKEDIGLAMHLAEMPLEGVKRENKKYSDWKAQADYKTASETKKQYDAYKLQPHEYPQGTKIGGDGLVYTNQVDDKGRPKMYSGVLQVRMDKLPQQLKKDIRSGSTKNENGEDITYDLISKYPDFVPVYIENGVPQYLGTKEKTEIGGVETESGYFPLVPNKKGKVPVGKPITTSKSSSSVSKSVESTKKVPTFNMK